MKFFFFSIFSVFFLSQLFIADAGLLRARKKDQNNEVVTGAQKRRELTWIFVPTGDVIDNNNSYDNYGQDEVPDDTSMNDSPDRLRAKDLCYKDGSYSLANCPEPPDCNFSGEFGPAKLCINRFPSPDREYYVGVMKCIPRWENCDKCVCGHISADNSDGGYCLTQGNNPDDDYLSFSCSSRTKLKFQKYSWTYQEATSVAVRVTPTPTPKPSIKPTPTPSSQHTTSIEPISSPATEPGSDDDVNSSYLDADLEATIDSLKNFNEPLETSSSTPTAQPTPSSKPTAQPTKMPSMNRDAYLEAAIELLQDHP
jgi:hypothetical protein